MSFAAGDTSSKTITINVAGDSTVEPGENFTVTLSNPSAGTTIGTATATGTIVNDDTAPGPALSSHGSTTYDAASNTYTLTTAGDQAGTVMSTARMDLRQNFAIALQVYLGTNDGGADGLAFVLHNDPAGVNAIGAPGSGLAIAGIRNGLGIEFDTYASNPGDTITGPQTLPATTPGFVDTDFASAPHRFQDRIIDNGQFHNVNVNWNAATADLKLHV